MFNFRTELYSGEMVPYTLTLHGLSLGSYGFTSIYQKSFLDNGSQ